MTHTITEYKNIISQIKIEMVELDAITTAFTKYSNYAETCPPNNNTIPELIHRFINTTCPTLRDLLQYLDWDVTTYRNMIHTPEYKRISLIDITQINHNWEMTKNDIHYLYNIILFVILFPIHDYLNIEKN